MLDTGIWFRYPLKSTSRLIAQSNEAKWRHRSWPRLISAALQPRPIDELSLAWSLKAECV
ncbi:hypothetical protein CY34DRAFT_800128 [Suillus luteus UH-Slu-Lm8-n1]|uniref:Unplaced genomic scaffold CY34scaffold_24, whole genome shotgun sequence n=1 Tax=Suillus luteus UH-Slu-Lm8-n1 TaxID=930992 RepID=A0A0D0BLH1_9AGAM|nr:hypothetical protein CY34DRAFT_800128 [Suillus luteus UH-Slu-Lm8-n1]